MTKVLLVKDETIYNIVPKATEPGFTYLDAPFYYEVADDYPAQIGWKLVNDEFVPPEPVEEAKVIIRVTKAEFGDLFTLQEHAAMNLLRWQIEQMDAADRVNPNNPLVTAQVIFQKFDLPAEFIELSHPTTEMGLGLLGLFGVFGANAEERIQTILNTPGTH